MRQPDSTGTGKMSPMEDSGKHNLEGWSSAARHPSSDFTYTRDVTGCKQKGVITVSFVQC